MGSIRTQIISGFLGVIALLGVVGSVVLVFQGYIEREHDQLDALLYREFGLVARSETLVRSFNEFRTAPTGRNDADYVNARRRLVEDMDVIESTALRNVNRAALLGMRGTVDSLVAATDDGMEAVRSGELTETVVHYEEANRVLEFVRENVSSLVIEELNITRTVRESQASRNRLTLVLGGVVLVFVALGSSVYSIALGSSIAEPLVILSRATRDISKGEYSVNLDRNLEGRSDEIGSLARSFKRMSTELEQTISGLRKTEDELKKQNTLLEKMNRLFVVREGRIDELKRELEHERKLHT